MEVFMKSYTLAILLFACFVLITPLGARGTLEPADTTLHLTDGLGRRVSFPESPERVVLAGRANLFLADAVYLFSSASDHVIALAQTDQGMGDFYPLLDPAYQHKRRLPNSAGVEEIMALQPDVVMIKDSMYSTIGRQLEELSLPVLTLGLESYDEYLRDIGLLGELFQEQSRAALLQKDMTDRVQRASRGLESEEQPEVLMLYYTAREGTSTFHTPPTGWIQTFMTETVGAHPVWVQEHSGNGWQVVNFEQIARWDPDMIFLISYTLPSRDVVSTLKASPLWQSLNAVQQDMLLPFPGDFHSWAQADIRWLLGLKWLAGQIHPRLYPDLDMEQEVISFYQYYLSVSPDVTEKHVLPLVKEDLPGRR